MRPFTFPHPKPLPHEEGGTYKLLFSLPTWWGKGRGWGGGKQLRNQSNSLPRRSVPAYHLLLAAALLGLVWLIRAHNPLEMPAFVDESLHIQRGQIVWSFSDWGESLNPKKLLYYYWIGLFGLNAPESLWLARTATALFALPGAALTYALAQCLFNRRAGLLALLLYALVPFMVFFERLALADAFTATICTAIVYASFGFARRPSTIRGAVIGVLLGLAVLAKLIALPFAALPVLAIMLFGRDRPRHANSRIYLTPKSPLPRGEGTNSNRSTPPRRLERGPGGEVKTTQSRLNVVRSTLSTLLPYRRPLLIGALMFGIVIVPSMAYVVIKEATGTKDRVVVEESLYVTEDRAGQVADNIEQVFRSAVTLLAPEFVALAGVLVAYLAWRNPRALTYLLAAVILPWSTVIVIAAALSTRYLVLGLPPLLVLVAGGTVDATEWVMRHRGGLIEPNWKPVLRLHWLSWALLVLWAVSFAVPFIVDAMTGPTDLNLPTRDEWEYFTHTSSGYALRDLAADLPDLPPGVDGRIPVIGFLPSCHSLPLYWTEANAVDLDCPLFKWDTSKQIEMADHLIFRAANETVLYMAVDQTGVFDLTQLPFEWEPLAEYPRPHHGKMVQLYRVRLAEG